MVLSVGWCVLGQGGVAGEGHDLVVVVGVDERGGVVKRGRNAEQKIRGTSYFGVFSSRVVWKWSEVQMYVKKGVAGILAFVSHGVGSRS